MGLRASEGVKKTRVEGVVDGGGIEGQKEEAEGGKQNRRGRWRARDERRKIVWRGGEDGECKNDE